MKLQDKVAVVTGGTSGIGAAIAWEFREQGARLAILARGEAALKQAESKLGGEVLAATCDISSVAELDRFYEQVGEQFGKVDVIVAGAGISPVIPLQQVEEAEFDQISDINFKGTYFTVQRALPYLNDGASVVLITSTANEAGVPGFSVYSATKAAVRALARSFAIELLDRRVRVNALSPGFVDTPILEKMGAGPEAREAMAQQVPMRRLARPEEIAKAALFLACDDSSYVTGAELSIDGGLSQV